MENLVVGAWETSTKKIVAYATLQGLKLTVALSSMFITLVYM